MSYSEKEPLKQLPEASSCPKFSGTGEYDHMEPINHIYGLFIDVPRIKDYWITARLNTAFKGHGSIWYTEMKEIHGRRSWPWWTSQIIQKYRNGTWIWQKPINCPKAKKKVYAIEQVPEEESPPEDSESDSMGDAIREKSDEDQDQREEFLVEYQVETQLETQDIQLEAQIPQDTANKNLCKHKPEAQTFLVTKTKGMIYIHGTSKKMTICIENSQHPSIIDSGAHCSIVAKDYLNNHFPNWGKQLFPTKAKKIKSPSGKITSIGTVIKEIIIPHRKGNIRLNPEFFVLEDAHIQGFLLGTDHIRFVYETVDNITINQQYYDCSYEIS
ncbi:hypothetical protein O181_016826 [Austropuccinia psidii MF-1]|uniref:Uncharacterized protein n=1 Tax=Austropuccinia psidii MF-1 TaxID=1389203 RepID=A0A9Q3C6G9_9BASI|nr:hypothetical protein [Austropuccinia psidii MF-1]